MKSALVAWLRLRSRGVSLRAELNEVKECKFL